MPRLICLLIMLLAATGCAPHHKVGYEPTYAADGFTRPKIVLIPLFDSSSPLLDWNVSYELTQAIREKIRADNTLYAFVEDLTFKRVLRMRHMSLDETMDRIWPIFAHAHFVILLELVQHDILPYERESNPEVCTIEGFRCNSTLQLKLRLTVLDVRCHHKKLVLEQMICSTQTIPKDYEFWNYCDTPWGSSCYEGTPVSCAHGRLVFIASEMIEKVVKGLK